MPRHDWNWFFIIAAAWVTLAAAVMFPASYWFEVDHIIVADSEPGVAPVMDVDRTVHRPFQARWIATVMRKDNGGFHTFCTATGENDYRPGSSLPENLDLDWWTWPTQCRLPAGQYYLKTLWELDIPGLPEKEVRGQSNMFTVK